jgi:hypothetical protein
VVEVVGVPSAQEPKFTGALAGLVEFGWQTHVVPLLRQAWPQVFDLPYRKKLREGFETYASLGLSVVVCSRQRPWVLRAAVSTAQALGLSDGAMAAAGSPLIPVMYRVVLPRQVRRVALMSALVLLLDEALDDSLGSLPPRDRPDEIRRVMHGERTVGPGVLAAVDAACKAVRREVRDDQDAERLRLAMEATHLWAVGDIANLLGEPDPLGLCHRRIGVTASMDLVAWGVSAYVGEMEREWMYGIAELGQMVDDWVDMEKDEGCGRRTPAHDGTWDLSTIRQAFTNAESTLLELARASGVTYPPFVELQRRTFRTQVQRMAQILVRNP